MSCAACQIHVQRALAAVPGVQEVTVDLLGNVAHITAEPSIAPETLNAAVRQAGYDVPATPTDNARHTSTATPVQEPEALPGSLGLRVLLALAAGLVAMGLSMPLMTAGAAATTDTLARAFMHITVPLLPAWLLGAPTNLLRWTLFALALLTMLFAAPEIYRAAWRAALHRSTNMNTLVALGTLVAFAASTYTTVAFSIGKASQNFSDVYFEAVILILAFLLAGRWLEARARRRATAALRAFAHTETGQARWIGEGSPPELASNPEALLNAPETLLPLDAIAVGDLVRILPGDRIPLDGIVLAGRSSVDESMLTGEPLPVTRSPGNKLFSGTLNLDGPLLLRATALGADSMQAQMARLLDRARATRAPLQRLADRVSAIFVPVVLALATLTFVAWALTDNIGPHHLGYGRALSLAIAVLVVACPCAMGLAVPAAVAVSLGTAARTGILIKGGEALERLATVDTIVFDKTGTLTEGKPQIAALQLAPGAPYPASALLAWASSLERISTHPLAAAVVQYATAHNAAGQGSTVADGVVVPGIGVRGHIDGHRVFVGRSSLRGKPGQPTLLPPEDLSEASFVDIVVDGQFLASMYAVDTLRPSAKDAVAALKQLGLTPIVVSGDSLRATVRVVSQLGLEKAYADRLPAEKVTAIEQLQEQGHKVAMVGDGLNDAAALARADAGVAMASGTDLAREAGHVLLLHHNLNLVPAAIRLARRTRRLMRQNLAWALLYNVLGIPLAAGVFLPHFGVALSPAFASAAMALSSVSVLLNSLRLARTTGPAPHA